MAAANTARAAAFFQRLIHIRMQCGEGGGEAAEDAGSDSEQQREGDDNPVEMNVVDAGKIFRQVADGRANRDRSQPNTDRRHR